MKTTQILVIPNKVCDYIDVTFQVSVGTIPLWFNILQQQKKVTLVVSKLTHQKYQKDVLYDNMNLGFFL